MERENTGFNDFVGKVPFKVQATQFQSVKPAL